MIVCFSFSEKESKVQEAEAARKAAMEAQLGEAGSSGRRKKKNK